MRQSSLCILLRENNREKEVLLAMKKRGFGQGKWNGVGGKFDHEKGDKDIISTALRETEEEIGVKVKNFEKVAILTFSFPYHSEWDQDVHVFLVNDWEGEPQETEEMRPKWFRVKEIPFSKMWEDDRHWLPKVLQGEKLKADFTFEQGEKMSGQNIEIVREIA